MLGLRVAYSQPVSLYQARPMVATIAPPQQEAGYAAYGGAGRKEQLR